MIRRSVFPPVFVLVALLAAGLVSLPAQMISGISQGPMPGVIPWNPNFDALKQAIGLSDAQIKVLRDIQQSRTAANQAVFGQIAAKQKEMNDLLNTGSTDAAAIGKLQIDTNRLRTQSMAQISGKEQMLAVLSAEQKAKLTELESALQLQRAANEAVQLGLLSYPAPPSGPGVPVPPAPAGAPHAAKKISSAKGTASTPSKNK